MVDDVDRAVAWCLQNVHRFGGDASRLVLVGQSAGAHLCSLLLLRKLAAAGPFDDAGDADDARRSARAGNRFVLARRPSRAAADMIEDGRVAPKSSSFAQVLFHRRRPAVGARRPQRVRRDLGALPRARDGRALEGARLRPGAAPRGEPPAGFHLEFFRDVQEHARPTPPRHRERLVARQGTGTFGCPPRHRDVWLPAQAMLDFVFGDEAGMDAASPTTVASSLAARFGTSRGGDLPPICLLHGTADMSAPPVRSPASESSDVTRPRRDPRTDQSAAAAAPGPVFGRTRDRGAAWTPRTDSPPRRRLDPADGLVAAYAAASRSARRSPRSSLRRGSRL